MHDLLRQFYDEDASFRRLRHEDQERLFGEWCRRNGIEAELEFVPGTVPNVLSAVIGAGVILYFLSYPVDALQGLRETPLIPFLLALSVLAQWIGRDRPVVQASNTTSRSVG